jgi:hypothetical protein
MLIAVFALLLAQEAVPTAPSEIAPAPRAVPPVAAPASTPPGDLSTAPPLPEGPLMPVARNERGETFLVIDRASKDGDIADFWTFEAFVPPIDVRPGAAVVQGLAHHQVNCSDNTDQTVASAGYNEEGAAIVALAASPPTPLVGQSAYDMIAHVLCSGLALPKSGETRGHAAALAVARHPSGG